MLLIRRGGSRHFCFDFCGEHFQGLLHVASNLLSSRQFVKKDKQWIAPLACLPELLLLVQQHVPQEHDIRISAEAQQDYDAFIRWQKRLQKVQEMGLSQSGGPQEPLSFPFRGNLPAYQRAAVEWLSLIFDGDYSHGAILGDVVGLGKTVEAIAFVESMRSEGRVESCLVICPASLKRKWANEVNKFAGAEAIVGEAKSRCTAKQWNAIWRGPRAYTILNWDIVWRYWDEIQQLSFDCLILDEVQYAKNHSAKRTRYARRLSRQVPMTIGLSATFLENTLEDLFSVFTIVAPDAFLGNFRVFDRHFIERDFFGGIKGYKNLDKARDRVAPYILRRHKEEVAGQLRGAIASDIVETDYWIQLGRSQRALYDDIRNKIVAKIADMERAGKIIMAEVLAELIYLRQACLSTALVGAKAEHVSSAKLDELLQIVTGFNPDEKTVIFCFFTDMVDQIAAALGSSAVAVHGKNVSVRDREAVCQQFRDDPTIRFFVTSDALREGVDLQVASTLVNFDLLWNPQSMQQRIGRIDRVGQRNDVLNVINLIAEGTVEERMKQVLDGKQDLFDTVVEGGFRSDRLTLKEVRGLLC